MEESKPLDEIKKSQKSISILSPQGITVTIPCIPYSNINFGHSKTRLGKGGYGEVFLAHIEGEIDPVAVKEFLAQDFSETTRRQIENEAKVMAEASIGSKYLVALKAYCLQPYCLVMERMEGNLYHLLHSKQEISWEKLYLTGLNISQGIHYLHTNKIVHGDLKSLNVLLTSMQLNTIPIVKLGDFGNVALKNSSSTLTNSQIGFGGTLAWTAPEILISDTAKPTMASDIYSLGMVFWELASRDDPFKKYGKMTGMKIMQGARETFPPGTPKEFQDVAEECWGPPDKRPSSLGVVNRLKFLWEKEQKLEIKRNTILQEETSTDYEAPISPIEDKKLISEGKVSKGSGEAKLILSQTDFKDNRKIVQIEDLITPSPAIASPTKTSNENKPESPSVETQSNSNMPSMHSSQVAVITGMSSPATISSEAKTKTVPLDEKKREQLMPLQNKLIKACEKGSLSEFQAVIAEGALVDLPDEQGKYPLYSAAYGMNLEMVQLIIKLLDKEAPTTGWQACEEHNNNYYDQIFLNMNFAPVTYGDWLILLKQVELNEFLADYHLAQAKKIYGEQNLNCQSMAAWKEWVGSHDIGLSLTNWAWGVYAGASTDKDTVLLNTEKGYDLSRNQIKRAIDDLQIKKLPTSHNSSIATQSSTSASSLHTSRSFFGGSSSPDEKEKKRLMPLQDELIRGCKNGSFSQVKTTIEKGAIADLPNEKGENPIYCAAWGMNPEIVAYLIERRTPNSFISWEGCQEHNWNHYGGTFLNKEFNPLSFDAWHTLLTQIEPNEFLASYHLEQVATHGTRKGISTDSFALLKIDVRLARDRENEKSGFWVQTKKDSARFYTAIGLPMSADDSGWHFSTTFSKTAEGYKTFKEQIKRSLLVAELQNPHQKTTELTNQSLG